MVGSIVKSLPKETLNCKELGVLFKVNSWMGQIIGKAIRDGRDIRFTIILKLADPDSFGHERVRLKNVSFDDLTLMDWEASSPGNIEAPFTFTDYDYLDEVDY